MPRMALRKSKVLPLTLSAGASFRRWKTESTGIISEYDVIDAAGGTFRDSNEASWPRIPAADGFFLFPRLANQTAITRGLPTPGPGVRRNLLATRSFSFLLTTVEGGSK